MMHVGILNDSLAGIIVVKLHSRHKRRRRRSGSRSRGGESSTLMAIGTTLLFARRATCNRSTGESLLVAARLVLVIGVLDLVSLLFFLGLSLPEILDFFGFFAPELANLLGDLWVW